MSVSVLTLTAIAYDRFKGSIFWNSLKICNFFHPAICRPLSHLSYSTSRYFLFSRSTRFTPTKLSFFTICRHVAQLLAIWVMSCLLAFPEALVLHAVSSFKEQPCVRWIVTIKNGRRVFTRIVCQWWHHLGPDQLCPNLELQHWPGLWRPQDCHPLCYAPHLHDRPLHQHHQQALEQWQDRRWH